MAHDDMVLAMNSMHLHTPSQQHANDCRSRLEKLPLELREQIYGYLLNGDLIRYMPQADTAAVHSHHYARLGGRSHSYDFQTKLLRVNKDFQGECSRYLYKHNIFVKIRFDMLWFHTILHMMDVPIITDRKTRNMKGHAFSVHLKWISPPCLVMRKCFRAPKQVRDIGCALMLMQDFHRSCGMLKVLCEYILPNAVSVSAQRGQAFEVPFVKPSDEPAMVVTVNNTTSATLSNTQLSEILNHIQTITGGGYKMQLIGLGEHSQIEAARKSMAPRIVWPRAVEWDRTDSALQWKREIDSLAIKGDVQGACYRYSCLFEHMTNSGALATPGHIMDDPDRVAAATRRGFLCFDLLLSRAALNLRDGRTVQVEGDLKMVRLFARAMPVPPSMWEHFAHLNLLLFICRPAGFLLAALCEDIERMLAPLRTLTIQSNHMSHDVAVLQATVDTIKRLGRSLKATIDITPERIFPQLSVYNLPFQVFDSQPACQASSRPDGLRRWQDVAHLAGLSTEDKLRIQELQRQNNIEVSSFT